MFGGLEGYSNDCPIVVWRIPVFNSSGSELLGFMVAKNPDDSTGSVYVKADKFTTYLSGLTWGF